MKTDHISPCKLHFNCFLLTSFLFLLSSLNAQITTTIYPTNSSMNTGYVRSTGAKYSDNMQVSTSTTNGRGWAKFPLTSIPVGSTVSAATIEFYTFGGSTSGSANTIRGFTGDPVAMSGTTLYNTIGTGSLFNSSTWTIGTTTTPSLNSRALAGGAQFVQGQISTGYVNFGFVRGSSNLHSIYGFSNTTYRVRLIVTYIPACSGTPAAGTANVNGNTSLQVCDNSSFSLNCTGQATGTGITANWQIGTSAGGPFSDISGASAATFSTSTTATRYYRYRVTCSNSGLSSYSNVLTVTYSTISNPTASNQTITCGQTATLTASGAPIGGDYMWYSNATGTTQVGTGATFTTPALTATTTYYVRSKLGLCNSALVPVTVTVNTTVASPTASGQTISCTQTATLIASGAPSGGSYTWYSNSTGTNQVGSGSSFTTPSLTSSTTYYVAATQSTGTFNFTSPTVNSTSNPGITTTYTAPSTPQPLGNATITVSARGDFDIPTSQEFLDVYGENSTYLGKISGPTNCSWYTGTYTVPLATLTNWVSNGSITLTFTPGTGVNTNQCNANAYEVYFTISYTTGSGCASTLVPVTVTVNQASTPSITNATVICNQSATLTASSNSPLTWYSNSTGTTQVGTGTTFTTPALTATTTYYVKAGSGACSSALVPVTVTVNQASTPSVTNATVICNQTAILTASSNSPLTWYSNSTGSTQVGTGTTFTTPALSATTTYYVQAGSGACASALVPVTATVNLAAGPTVTGTTLICGSGSTTLTATGSGNPIQWYSDAAATNLLGTGTTYTTPNLSANTTYHVREGAAASVQTFTYTSPVTATYTTGGAVSITVPSTPTGASGNGTLTVYLIGDLNGTTETVSISSETGSIATGVNTGTQCSATYWSTTYSLTAANINSWASNGTINFNFQSSTGVNNICTAGAAFQVYVTLTYNYNTVLSPCNSLLTPVTVTINPTSVAGTASSNQTICSGATASLTLTGQTGTIQWQQSANGTSGWSNVTMGTGATTSSYTTAALSATTFYRAVVTSGVCSSVNSNVITVTVNPTSVAGTAGSDQTICSGATASLTLTGQTGTIQWQQSVNGTSGWSNVTTGTGATTTSYTSASLSATTYYRAVVASGVCSSDNSNVVTVTVNQPSVNPTSITTSSICLGASTTLTAVGGSLGIGANYQWGTGLIIGSNPISGATASTLSVSPATTTVYWVQIVNGTGPCSATTAGLTTTVTVNTPTIATIPTAGSVVWRGATSTTWTTASNWYAYDGSNYTVATSTPISTSNVIIPANQSCVSQQPTVISGTVDANAVTIETGAALTMTTGTLNVVGNFTVNGTGTFAPGTGTVNFTGGNGVTQVVTNGTQVFNNVTVSGFGTVQMTGNTTINGDFLNTDGTLDMNNFNLTVGGNYANYNSTSGLLPGTGTVIFNKASGTQTVDQLTLDFNHIQHSGAGTLQLLSDISTTGDIINSAGTFDANDKIITVKNNFSNTATFTPGTGGLGEIYFEKVGGTQTLTPGNAVFQKLAHTGTGTLNLTGTIEVKGDVVIDAPISAGTSTLKLSGTGNQTMSGTQSVIELKDMAVAKTAGTVTLSKPVRVDGALTMTQGNIITSATNKLEIGSSTSSLGSVIWTGGNVVGPMRRWFAGITNSTAASGMFPVGLSTVNRYAQVNFTQAPGSGGYIDIEYKAGPPANVANWTYLTTPDGQLIQTFEDEGYWDITPYDASGNAYPSGLNTSEFTLNLRANGLASVNDMSVTRIIRSPGPNHTTWEPAGFHISANGTTNDFVIQSNTVTGFSWFNIGAPNNSPLPVELLNFNGSCNEGMVNLVWQTASEFNSSHFDVEKSTDGETWRVIATIPSAGTSNELLTYQTVDQNGTDGNNYYRLRQVDIDGTEKEYDPINVSCTEVTPGYFSSFPNPSGSSFQLIVKNKDLIGTCVLNIIDATGKVIEQREIEVKDGINMFVISEELNPGIYFLNINNRIKTTQVIRHSIK
jgi:hypothetical protein